MQAGRLFSILLLLPLAGCGNRTFERINNELLERELSQRDIALREINDELKRLESQNQAMNREIDSMRKGRPSASEDSTQTFSIKKISLARGTGGFNKDDLPGDDGLIILLQPLDGDEHAVKAQGTLQVGVQEISSEGLKVPLSTWDLDAEQLRKSWKQGLFSSSYTFQLPWREVPQSDKLRITARLALNDGRVLEADRDVQVRLPAGVKPRIFTPATGEKTELPPPVFPIPQSKAAGDSGTVRAVSLWQPASLHGAVKLGSPEPIGPPVAPVVNLQGITEDWSNRLMSGESALDLFR